MDRFLTIIRLYKIPLVLGAGSVIAIAFSIVLLVKSVATTAPIEFSDSSVASTSGEIKVDVEGAVKNPGLYSVPEGGRVEDAISAAGGLTADVDDQQFAKTVNRAMKLVDGAKIFIPVVSSSPLSSPNSQSTLISVNSGTENQLDTLPGVGPVTAKKIIDYRPYQTLEELVSKKALGAALFEKIKNQLSL